MSPPTKSTILIGILMLTIVTIGILSGNIYRDTPGIQEPWNDNVSSWSYRRVRVEGDSMYPLIPPGAIIEYDPMSYRDAIIQSSSWLSVSWGTLPKRWDIVIFEHSSNQNYLIKKVLVTDDNEIEIGEDWNTLLVDQATLVNSAWETYIFSDAEMSMLQLYIHDGHIPTWTYLIFWDNTQVSHDSRKFGAVSIDSFRWKVITTK